MIIFLTIYFLTIYLLMGGVYIVHLFINANLKYQCNKIITEMLSDHDWFSVLCVILLMLIWIFLGVLSVIAWPIWVLGNIVMMLIDKIRKN